MNNSILLFSTVTDTDDWYMPLSVITLGSHLEKHGFNVKVIDYQITRDWENMVNLSDYFLVGISSMVGPCIRNVYDILEKIEKSTAKPYIVIGGYFGSICYREILENLNVDFVIRGEGEDALLSLAQALSDTSNFSLFDKINSIGNLSFKNADKIISTPCRKVNIDSLTKLNYNLIDLQKYIKHNNNYFSYVTSYGCPNKCSYCAEPLHFNMRWYGKSPEKVVSEITEIYTKYKPNRIDFMDPNFAASPQRAVKITQLLRNMQLPIQIVANMTVKEIIAINKYCGLLAFKKAGFNKIFVGIESVNDRILNLLKKNQSRNDIMNACILLSDAGITPYASFMYCFPGETIDESEETLSFAESLCQKITNIKQLHHVFMPLPHTELALYTEQVINDYPDWVLDEYSTYGNKIKINEDVKKYVFTRINELKTKYPIQLKHQELNQ